MSMNTVRVGAARFVMTTMSPFFSAMNKRLVSPGRLAIATGLVKLTPGNAFVNVKPVEGGLVGNCSVVFGTRCKGPAPTADEAPSRRKAMPPRNCNSRAKHLDAFVWSKLTGE